MKKAVQDKEHLVSLLRANSPKIRSYGVSNLSIFGAFVSGKLRADSDIDFLVEFNPKKKNFDNFMDLSFYLQDLLGRKVEIITTQSLNKYIGPYIQKQAEHVVL